MVLLSWVKSAFRWIYNKLFGNTPKRVVFAFGIMLAVILLLLAIVIYRKPSPDLTIDNEKAHRDTIIQLLKQKAVSDSAIAKYKKQNDSLVYYSGFIRTYYKKKKIYVYEQSISELDSTIRAEW